MNKVKTIFSFLVVGMIAWLYLSCEKKEYRKLDCSEHPHAFTADIKPIIDVSCAVVGCHVSGSANGDFTTYAGIRASVEGGNFEDAVLYDQDMPPSGPLPKSQRQAIKCWLEEGAPNN